MKNIFLFISSEAIKDFEDKVIDSTYAISPLKPLSHFLNLGTLVGFIYIFWFSLLSTSSLLKLCTALFFSYHFNKVNNIDNLFKYYPLFEIMWYVLLKVRGIDWNVMSLACHKKRYLICVEFLNFRNIR